MVTAPARRELVRHLVAKGLSERRSLAVVRMSASAYRYAPRPDRNVELRARILALAQRHRRYGVGMIHLKLRQAGLLVNYKRVERLYQEAKLQVRRRKRKKVLPGERQPLIRPLAANQVWSMDFVFDRTAEGRVIKCLTIVDDATHEAVAIEVEQAISGLGAPARCADTTDPAREAQPERLCRVLQRAAAGRVSQRTLVHPPAARPDGHRDLAPGVQRGAAEEGTRRPNTERLREATGIRYHQPRTLNRPATESGGTSLPRHEHEETILIALCQSGPAAFFLSERERFKWFESLGNNHWHGLIIPNVRIEVDETSVFEPSRIEARAGTVIRWGAQLVAQAKSLRAFSGVDPIILEDGLAETSSGSAGFSRWQVVLGVGPEKRMLCALSIT